MNTHLPCLSALEQDTGSLPALEATLVVGDKRKENFPTGIDMSITLSLLSFILRNQNQAPPSLLPPPPLPLPLPPPLPRILVLSGSKPLCGKIKPQRGEGRQIGQSSCCRMWWAAERNDRTEDMRRPGVLWHTHTERKKKKREQQWSFSCIFKQEKRDLWNGFVLTNVLRILYHILDELLSHRKDGSTRSRLLDSKMTSLSLCVSKTVSLKSQEHKSAKILSNPVRLALISLAARLDAGSSFTQIKGNASDALSKKH